MKIFQKVTIHSKNAAQIICFLQLVDSIVCLTTAHAQNGVVNDKRRSNPTDLQTKTWNIQNNDRNIDLYSDLIHILEKLEVFTVKENSSACIALEKIVRNVASENAGDNSRNVEVHLYFKQTTHSSDKDGYISTTSADNPNSNHPDMATIIGVNANGIADKGCGNGAAFSTSGLDSLSMRQETSNSTGHREGNQTLTAHPADERRKGEKRYSDPSEVVPVPLPHRASLCDRFDGCQNCIMYHRSIQSAHLNIYASLEDNIQYRLSRTQVVVIATCSAVIGTFFIIAGALRISNFYKRYHERRAILERLDRQNSNMGFPGFPSNYGDLRRPSAASKVSRQGSAVVPGGSECHVNKLGKSANTSQSPSPVNASDHKPLLWLTSLANNNQTSAGSSHGSLAYIDEDEQSRIKFQDGELSMEENDSEDDPLLRKSPDSGSSIDANTDDVGRKEYVASTHTSNSDNRNLSDYNRSVDEVNEMVVNDIDTSLGYDDEYANNSASNCDITPDYVSEPNIVSTKTDDMDIMITEPEVSVDDDAVPLEEGVSPFENISESFVVTIGLNQSESSLSNNPSYCYGNQSEYALDGGYGNNAYSSPYQNQFSHEMYKHDHYLDRNMHDSMDNDSGYRGNGLYIESDACQSENDSPGETSAKDVMSISNDSSGEPQLPAEAQCMASSIGDMTESGADNRLALLEYVAIPNRSPNLHKQFTVESQIIPLSEYNTLAP